VRFAVLIPKAKCGKVQGMNRRLFPDSRILSLLSELFLLGLWMAFPARSAAEPPPAAVSQFNAYVGLVEARLALQHRSPNAFLAADILTSRTEERLRRGELIIENINPTNGTALPGAMLHHWRGTAFVSGAGAVDLERLMKDVGAYPQRFAPQVLQARVLTQQGDRLHATMRVQQRHVITVVMDTAYDITFAQLDAAHGYSISRSTHISEIDSPGTSSERALTSNEEHGFLWRQNTYWTYEERDGGLYVQVESVSLTRSIPNGLGWGVRPFVESVPRDSLEFILRATCNALGRAH
jgi:hypothetical protein